MAGASEGGGGGGGGSKEKAMMFLGLLTTGDPGVLGTIHVNAQLALAACVLQSSVFVSAGEHGARLREMVEIIQSSLTYLPSSSVFDESTKTFVAALARAVLNVDTSPGIADRVLRREEGILSGGRTSTNKRDMCLMLGGVICRTVMGNVPAEMRDLFAQTLRSTLFADPSPPAEEAWFTNTSYPRPAHRPAPEEANKAYAQVVQGVIAALHIETMQGSSVPDDFSAMIRAFGQECVSREAGPANVVHAALVCYLMAGPADADAPITFLTPGPGPGSLEIVGSMSWYGPPNFTCVLRSFTKVMEAVSDRGGCTAYSFPPLSTYYKDIVPSMCFFIPSDAALHEDPTVCQLLVETLARSQLRPNIEQCLAALGRWAEALNDLEDAVTGSRGQQVAIDLALQCAARYPACADIAHHVCDHLRLVQHGRRRWSVLRAAWVGAVAKGQAARKTASTRR